MKSTDILRNQTVGMYKSLTVAGASSHLNEQAWFIEDNRPTKEVLPV